MPLRSQLNFTIAGFDQSIAIGLDVIGSLTAGAGGGAA
jgi:hypothetical protein